MFYVIGTAGHVDHGKTTLVKALTGVDTDRLKEEKERGISIELGFAYFTLPDGARAGVVDVPGHERFIRHMLAGAHGVDLVLFTVAADDGVMPQTEEHLDILHLLGVERAIFVVTKTDLASNERIRDVEEEIEILTAGTSLASSPVIRFSSVTREGLPEVAAEIARTLQTWTRPRAPGYFRLPVDRVFALPGHGLIVTGTSIGGEIGVGDRVRCLPGDQAFRIRSLQVHNEPVRSATGGQRVALNLTGQDKPSVERGQVICHESITRTSDRFDAVLEVRPAAAKGIRNHQRVRVHLGTAERLAKVILLEGRDLAEPKQSVYCQIALSEPLVALRGDHFVIRNETAERTLGGGIVIRPWAGKHKKIDAALVNRLKALHNGDVQHLVEGLLEESGELAVPISSIREFLNMGEQEVRKELGAMRTIRVFSLEGEELYGTERAWERTRDIVLTTLEGFHAAHPLAPGMEWEAVRERLPYRTTPRLFHAVVTELETKNAVVRDDRVLRLPTHTIQLRDDEKNLAETLRQLLARNPVGPPDLKQIEQEIGIDRMKLGEIVRVMEREGTIVRVALDLYFLADRIDQMKETLRQHLAHHGAITPGGFRDLFGTSRKYAIPLLEYFDREGVTFRSGDTRRLRNPTVAVKRVGT
jgi:selenocysteine-specific elongation factor